MQIQLPIDESAGVGAGRHFPPPRPGLPHHVGDSLSHEQKQALRAIGVCRTAALGGHVDQCDQCGYRKISYSGGGTDGARGDAELTAGGRKAAMAHQQLNGPEIGARFEQMDGEGVP